MHVFYPRIWRQRQVNLFDFKAILIYIMSSRLARVTYVSINSFNPTITCRISTTAFPTLQMGKLSTERLSSLLRVKQQVTRSEFSRLCGCFPLLEVLSGSQRHLLQQHPD